MVERQSGKRYFILTAPKGVETILVARVFGKEEVQEELMRTGKQFEFVEIGGFSSKGSWKMTLKNLSPVTRYILVFDGMKGVKGDKDIRKMLEEFTNALGKEAFEFVSIVFTNWSDEEHHKKRRKEENDDEQKRTTQINEILQDIGIDTGKHGVNCTFIEPVILLYGQCEQTESPSFPKTKISQWVENIISLRQNLFEPSKVNDKEIMNGTDEPAFDNNSLNANTKKQVATKIKKSLNEEPSQLLYQFKKTMKEIEILESTFRNESETQKQRVAELRVILERIFGCGFHIGSKVFSGEAYDMNEEESE